MSANDGLAGVKRALLSIPLRKSDAGQKCTCSPSNTLGDVGVQVLALGQIRDEPGCVPEFREHHPLPMVLRLVATVLLARLRIFLLFWLHAC